MDARTLRRRAVLLLTLWLSFASQARAAPPADAVVVDPSGNGDFTSVQEAVQSNPPLGAEGWRRVYIRDGTYTESVDVLEGAGPMLIEGESRDGVVLQLDECFTNPQGRWLAEPVVQVFSDDVILRSMTVWNLADEPGGCGGLWDFAVMTFADRVVLDHVFLRADHDTLIVYGDRYRVYVNDSHIQGRGDFIASFSSTFIENSVLETIRDRGHFLFQQGEPGVPLEEQEFLVVRDTTFTGQTQDPVWPFGVTNLYTDAVVYLIDNVFEHEIGANRPVLHYHDETQPELSTIYRHGNAQALSQFPLIWHLYSVPGPAGVPRINYPILGGPPSVSVLMEAEVDAVVPDESFWGWDAREALDVPEPGFDLQIALGLIFLATLARRGQKGIVRALSSRIHFMAGSRARC